MNEPDTLLGAFGTVAQFIGTAMFQWLPGAANTALVPGQPGSLVPPVSPISDPVGFGQMISFLNQTSLASTQYPLYQKWVSFVFFSVFISLCLIAFIIYCTMRIKQIREAEEEKFAASAHTIQALDVSRTQMRWNRIMQQIASDNEQNWRLAILEADIMLNELLDVLGYRGETMGDKMRNVERADFNTIDMAWEAHRARNKIAHEGSALLLNMREARRIMAMYERVFREFQFIE